MALLKGFQTVGGVFVFSFALAIAAGSAKANIYDFTYQGIAGTNFADVFGSGTFTTGTPYADGYAPIVSISGTTNEGTISGLVTSGGAGTDPGSGSDSCCGVGPGGDYFTYDNAYLQNSSNPFSSTGGLLFDIAGAGNGITGYRTNPINIFGDANGNSYEFSYGEDNFTGSGPSYGGTEIRFTATDVSDLRLTDVSATPEPNFYGVVTLCMGGLLLARWRRRKTA